jgi:hypothetical protein
MAKTINERIKEATRQAAPSMVPADFEAPPKVEEVVPDITEVISDRTVRLKVKQLVIQSAEIGLQEKELRKARTPITNSIKKYLSDWQVGKMNVDQFRVNFYSVPRESIKKDKLVVALSSLGMLPADINRVLVAATTFTNVPTLRIGLQGDDDDE